MADPLSIAMDGRIPGGGDRIERLRKAAEAFEGFFVREILEATERDLFSDEEAGPIGGSKAVDQYQALLNDGLAERAAGGMGIADLIVRHLITSGAVRAPSESGSGDPTGDLP